MIVKIILILEVVMKQLSNDQLNNYVGGGCSFWMGVASLAAYAVSGPIGGTAATLMGMAACEYLERHRR